MRTIDLIRMAFKGLTVHRSRSALTILGIVIGITAVVMVTAVGQSAQKLIDGELAGLGAETVVIRPGKEPQGPSDFASTLLNDSLKKKELDALSNKSNVPDLKYITPEVIVYGDISYGGNTYRKGFIIGSLGEFMADSMKLELAEGESFTESDDKSKARVVIIGSNVKEELFGNNGALGEKIDISGKKFRVVGIFKPRGRVVFFNVDDVLIIPPSSAQAYITGTNYYNEIIARADTPEHVDRMVVDITTTLRNLHNIENPIDDDFSIQTQKGLVSQVSNIVGAFTVFLSLVVAISLLVGGIGIMNIMLVSVTERTKEIGLRKAIGATNRNILMQFLFEAVILTLAGGIVGIIFGILFTLLGLAAARYFTEVNFAFSLPINGVLLGVFVSLAIGLVFGIFPARQASMKSPIEALRSE